MLTHNASPGQVVVKRDQNGSSEPVIVKRRQRRLSGVDAIVLSQGHPPARSACGRRPGLTTGEISARFAEIYRASVSKDTVSKITEKVIEDM